MTIFRDVMLVFPLLVFFLAGGACGALFVAPRIYSHRGLFRSAVPEPESRWKDQPDVLEASVSLLPCGSSTVSRLRVAALEQGRAMYGDDAQLSIEAVGKLYSMPSGKVGSSVIVRRLSPEGAAYDRA